MHFKQRALRWHFSDEKYGYPSGAFIIRKSQISSCRGSYTEDTDSGTLLINKRVRRPTTECRMATIYFVFYS